MNKKPLLLAEGLKAAELTNYKDMNVDVIARTCGCSRATLLYKFGSTANFRNEVMREAIRMRNHTVITQGIVDSHPILDDIDTELKRQSWDSFL